MTFQPAHKDTTKPPGQIVNPIPVQQSEMLPRSKTLGSIIDRIAREEGVATLEEKLKEARQQGYAEGFIDGQKQGFIEGIAWVKGV
jgi:flagellar biosynthesis/type III secretory pathway protein FliH